MNQCKACGEIIEHEGYCDNCVNDVCFLCGQPGADKYAHPIHWPGEAGAAGTLVHAACEDEECRRAHAMLSPKERDAFLRTL